MPKQPAAHRRSWMSKTKTSDECKSSVIRGRGSVVLHLFPNYFSAGSFPDGTCEVKTKGFWKCCAFPSDLRFSGLPETRVTATAGAARGTRCFFETYSLWVKKLHPAFSQHGAEKGKTAWKSEGRPAAKELKRPRGGKKYFGRKNNSGGSSVCDPR